MATFSMLPAKVRKPLVFTLIVICAFLVGKYSSPSRTEIKEVEKIVYQDTISKDTDVQIETKTIETLKPDGSIVRETVEVKTDKSQIKRESQLNSEKLNIDIKENRPNWMLGLGYDPPLKQKESYNLDLQTRVIGEIYAGLSFSSNRTVGLKLSIGF